MLVNEKTYRLLIRNSLIVNGFSKRNLLLFLSIKYFDTLYDHQKIVTLIHLLETFRLFIIITKNPPQSLCLSEMTHKNNRF